MIALIDGDIVAYRCAAAAENFDVSVGIDWASNLIKDIIDATEADQYKIFLSGGDQFRKKLDPQYKANRKDVVKPKWLADLQLFLVTDWHAETTDGYEADDALGMLQTKYGRGSTICSLDKDLLQIPGHHYNFAKKLHQTITWEQGIKFFYTQTLVGDTADNVVGVRGIGPVKANKILSACSPEEYYRVCKELYDSEERYHTNCKLLWIWRKMNDEWTPTYGSDSEESKEENTASKEVQQTKEAAPLQV